MAVPLPVDYQSGIDSQFQNELVVVRSIYSLEGLTVPVGANGAGFWTDSDAGNGNGVNISRLQDRAFVGAASDITGSRTRVTFNDNSWVGHASEAAGFMFYYESRSQFASFARFGTIAGAFATRTSDLPASELAGNHPSIGVAIYAHNDKTDIKHGCWGTYSHVARNANAGSLFNIEMDITNSGDTIDYNPYTAHTSIQGVTANLWLQGGGETASPGGGTSNPNSACIGINNNGGNFAKAIVIGRTAIDGCDGSTGTGPAFVMAKGHEIQWMYGSGATNIGGRIRSDATDSTVAASIVFLNNGLSINQGSPEQQIAQFVSAASVVNPIVFSLSTTGQPIVVRPSSTVGDTNCAIILRSKGSSGVALQSGDSTNKVAVNNTGIGFFATAQVAKQTVSGSRASPEAALANLLTALANYGLITNSTTA